MSRMNELEIRRLNQEIESEWDFINGGNQDDDESSY